MSYILEALKKSERERRRGQPPDLHALPAEAPSFRRRGVNRRSLGRVAAKSLLLAALALLAVLLLAGISLWLDPKNTSSDEPGESAGTTRQKDPPSLPAPEKIQEELAATATGEEEARPAGTRINIRPELPNLRFAGHTYAEDPARRMIMVNGRIIREGDRIDGQLRLHEITWEGVVVDHQGLLLHVKTQ